MKDVGESSQTIIVPPRLDSNRVSADVPNLPSSQIGVPTVKLNEAGKLFVEGYRALNEHGCEKNVDYAIEWLERSANSGNVSALMELARIYEEGIGEKINIAIAFPNYYSAAQKMEPHGLFKVAELIEKGVGEKVENVQERNK